MKLCQNTDPPVRAVQQFEERVMKESHKFVEELDSLSLEYHEPWCWSVSDLEKKIIGQKLKEHLKKANICGSVG